MWILLSLFRWRPLRFFCRCSSSVVCLSFSIFFFPSLLLVFVFFLPPMVFSSTISFLAIGFFYFCRGPVLCYSSEFRTALSFGTSDPLPSFSASSCGFFPVLSLPLLRSFLTIDPCALSSCSDLLSDTSFTSQQDCPLRPAPAQTLRACPFPLLDSESVPVLTCSLIRAFLLPVLFDSLFNGLAEMLSSRF